VRPGGRVTFTHSLALLPFDHLPSLRRCSAFEGQALATLNTPFQTMLKETGAWHEVAGCSCVPRGHLKVLAGWAGRAMRFQLNERLKGITAASEGR